ncbi:class C sortase [Lacticaseibacillus jixiensis]|uniref:class C sortase n=1 Tax=Lacticaseibacillus jixiensis TaxID=3231926 RepID=UPI0036F196FF
MSNKLKDLLVWAIFCLGLGIFAYPFVANAYHTVHTHIQTQRRQAVAKRNAEQAATARKQANADLAANGIRPSGDVFKRDATGNSAQAYLNQHLIGAVTIPDINVSIPLYDTTNATLLESGATVLANTSFPSGGKNTHTVISAHSGLPTKELFTDLPKLKRGQQFILTVGKRHLAYQVDRIQTILPTDINALKIESGRDLATLMTCTPYGVNSHRLLVTGHRVPYSAKTASARDNAATKQLHHAWYWLIGAALAAIVALVWLVRMFRRGKHKPKAA